MKKLFAFLSIFMFATSANAVDIIALANKAQTAAEEASAKLEKIQSQDKNTTLEAQKKIETKIEKLKTKIAKWQSSDDVNTDETQKAIANAKASIEKLMAQLKALQVIQ